MADLFLIPGKLLAEILQGLRWQRNFKVIGTTFRNSPERAVLTIGGVAPARPQRPATDVTVAIDSPFSGAGGKYGGLILAPPASPVVTTGNLTAADCGDASGEVACVVLNANEIGQSTHKLTAAGNTDQRVFNGRFVGTTADGVPVVVINGLWTKPCAT